MQQYRIETIHKKERKDPDGLSALGEAQDLGIAGIERIHAMDVYIVDGNPDIHEIRQLAENLFIDPVVQEYRVCGIDDITWPWAEEGEVHTIEVNRKPGVMDPSRQSAMKGAADLGLADKLESIRTARKYCVRGDVPEEEIEHLARGALANTTIEDVHINTEQVRYPLRSLDYEFERKTIPLRTADDDQLMEISREGMLSLTLEEMQTIRDRFQELERDPTDLELEILAQTWSEHCVHKTLKGHVTYEGPVPEGWEDYTDEKGRLIIDNMLKETIARATHELDKSWCLSVFVDNAGIIDFTEDQALCFKVETHNHPSAIEPYGGANTGIGGVIRDPLGTGRGARPIVNTDVFCFGPPDIAEEDVPEGALHPRRVMKGVVGGVRDYGNRMGIPTANGAVYFDSRYIGNPLVYCGNVGLMPKNRIEKAPEPGDYVLVVGGRTGRDGIHGATFSSAELTSDSEETAGTAVQIGNPITEKKLVDTLMQAREEDLYDCITDCGAGGLSSAVGEMGENTGVEAEIGDVPLKYEGLSYTEIWISEAQERMVLSVPPDNLERIMEIFSAEDVESTVIGRFTDDDMLTVRYDGNTVAELDMEFLHEGLPRFTETACWEPPEPPDPLVPETTADAGGEQQKACNVFRDNPPDLSGTLEKILAAPNVRSKEWIIRQYDHEVQGQTVLKPLVGRENDGPGDGTVIAPILGDQRGFALGCGMNPKYGDIDAYHSAAGAMDEALRNVVAVGGELDRTAVLDNFCWGNTRKPEQLGTLVRACLACYDCAKDYGVPFISGKDSLNNEFSTGEETIAIPPTLLISAISIMDDVRNAVTMDLKAPGNHLYLIGNTYPELGGSHYYSLLGLTGQTVPRVRRKTARSTMRRLSTAIGEGLVASCHDLSEGGLAVSAAEMAFSGGCGARIDLAEVPFEGDDETRREDVLLFSESHSRFLVEVEPQSGGQFAPMFSDLPAARIGTVTDGDRLVVNDLNGSPALSATLDGLKSAWQTPLFPGHD
ncbi:MAG: phosphoribosylformylglycinamidine synthase subunit PurL [Candidatus Brocadiia bacterium]